jgi:sugar phosphate isomerase/epimerase
MQPGDVPRWTRRQLLALSAGGAVTSGRAVLGAGRFQPSTRPWGVQLYTVREQMRTDAAATLRRVAALGYTELEVLQPTLSVVAPLAKDLGLQVVSVHLDAATARGEGFDALLAEARRHGLRYVVFPFVLPAERPPDRAGFGALAQRLARMSRAASALGLRFCYHNHAFEFGRDRDGTPWLDVLMQGTAAADMGLELDVFWAAIAGDDPVALLRRYAGRVALVHLKDKDPRAATSLVESQVPRTAFVEVGSGALDFTAILAAARTAGVAHYFVEQDQTPGDPFDSLKKSHDYLSGLAAK